MSAVGHLRSLLGMSGGDAVRGDALGATVTDIGADPKQAVRGILERRRCAPRRAELRAAARHDLHRRPLADRLGPAPSTPPTPTPAPRLPKPGDGRSEPHA